MAENGKGVSKSAAGLMAGLAFAAGLFIGVVVSGELRQETGPMAPASGPAAGPAQSGQQILPEMARHIAHLEEEVARKPDDANGWVQLGNAYFDTHQPEKAIQAYERSLELAPGDPNVLTDLGVMYRAAGQPRKALENFDKAIAADPKHEIARLNKGVVLLNDLGEREAALKSWEELLALNPEAMTPSGRRVADLVRELKGGAPTQ